jgi:superfamily II DNA/RNA helicase
VRFDRLAQTAAAQCGDGTHAAGIAGTLVAHLGDRVGEIHSDLDQNDREKVLQEFKNRRLKILVATDILSRGIDIEDIDMVINYDVPHDGEDYVHRIGRTARAESDGAAVTLVNEKEQNRFSRIEKLLGNEVPKATVPEEFGEVPAYNPRTFKSGNRRNFRKSGGKGNFNKSRNFSKGNSSKEKA